jgi:hypothetical protein
MINLTDPILVGLFALGGVLIGSTLTAWNARRANDLSDMNARRIDATAKSLKLSDHRVAWIQKLRDEMATFQSWGMTPGIDQVAQREFFEHGTRIELLMNPADPDYPRLQELMYVLLEAGSVVEKFSVNAEFIALCQRILKREWEVAKAESVGPLFLDRKKIWKAPAVSVMRPPRKARNLRVREFDF